MLRYCPSEEFFPVVQFEPLKLQVLATSPYFILSAIVEKLVPLSFNSLMQFRLLANYPLGFSSSDQVQLS